MRTETPYPLSPFPLSEKGGNFAGMPFPLPDRGGAGVGSKLQNSCQYASRSIEAVPMVITMGTMLLFDEPRRWVLKRWNTNEMRRPVHREF